MSRLQQVVTSYPRAHAAEVMTSAAPGETWAMPSIGDRAVAP